MMNEHQLQRANEIVGIAGGILTVAIMLRILRPDLFTTLRLRGYRAVSRSAKHGAEVLTSVAASADTAYHRLTNVTV